VINVELLEQVKQHILMEPRRLDMGLWSHNCDPDNPDNSPCGTTACIGGWAIILAGEKEGGWPGGQAARLLGLSKEQASLLFHVSYWPDEYRLRYRDIQESEVPIPNSRALKAQIVAERIDFFIKTNGTDRLDEPSIIEKVE
jgi:hypothetical protein